MPMSRGSLTRALQYLFFLGSIYSVYLNLPLGLLLSLILFIFFQIFALNIGLHRYFCHQSFKLSHKVEPFFAIISTLIGQGSIITWSGQHGHHHDHSDTEQDIHSPHVQSIPHILFGVWKLNIKNKKNIVHLLKKPFILFLHRHYLKIHLIYALVIYSISPFYFFYGYCLPNTLCLLSSYSLAIINHWHGYQTYDTQDKSTNSWVSNILTLGEGWHNNHHHNPGRFYQGETLWQFDPPAIIIKFIATKN